MIALLLATVFAAGFGLLIRVAQGMGANLVAVGATNYLTATLVNATLFVAGGAHAPHPLTAAIAVAGGACYASAFFLVERLTRRRGASITGAVMRISTLIPVGFSLLAWGERLSSWQAAGAAVALVSLPMLTLKPSAARRPGEARRPDSGARDGGAPRDGALLPVALFFLNGLCLLAPRAFRATPAADGEEAVFLAMLFATAATTLCIAWAVSERRAVPARAGTAVPRHPLWLDLVPGLAVGVCNALQNRFMIAALMRLPGTLVYPFTAAVGLVLTVAVARLAWRERFGALGAAGIALAAVAVVLVNVATGSP